jgi:TM2 domain-containing membrane protein YozV
MYKIIGADNQQYGPVNLDQMRRWITENRVRAETLVQAEGSTEWKPLSSFPELAAELKTAPPPFASSSAVPPFASMSNPRASNKIPAGICGIILGGLGVHKFILGYTGTGLIMLLVSVVSCGTLYPVMHIIGIIEGIIYLTKTDDEFVRIYVEGRKEWF